MTPRRLNIRDSAAYIGVAYETFRKWRHRGLIPIPCIKFNPHAKSGTVLYEVADLDAWIASRKVSR